MPDSCNVLPGFGCFNLVGFDPAAGRPRVLARGENVWTYAWADSAARLFAGADPAARITMMYIEYANLAAPGDTIDPPTINRSDALNYYQNLVADSQRDYIRVPLSFPPQLAQDANYSGTQYLAAGQYNQIVASAVTAGSQGVNGKPFANASNSTVTGVALVSGRVPNDPTQDVVCFRGYFATNKQILLPASGALAVIYAATFT